MTTMLSKTNKLKIGVLAALLLTVGQQATVFAANNSIRVYDKISCKNVKSLHDHSSGFLTFFDPAHAGKPKHLDLNAFLSTSQRHKLGKDDSETFSKFRFGTKEVHDHKNRLKFEAWKFDKNLNNELNRISKNHKKFTEVNICNLRPSAGLMRDAR